VPEVSFDIECWVSVGNPSQFYWLLHNAGTRFPKETLPSQHAQAIFTVTASQATTIQFYTGVYGNSVTGLDGWDKRTTFQFPFDAGQNPYHFSHIETTADSQYRNCTLRVFYTIKRELV
jgi:hypothetical protein